MTLSSADLIYLATVLCEIDRKEEAMSYMNQYVAAKPLLDRAERTTYLTILKRLIDGERNTIQTLSNALVCGNTCGSTAMLSSRRSDEISYLNKLCRDTIQLIDDALLPNASDSQARVFFGKMRGDMFRYMAEYEDDEQAREVINKDADETYKLALNDATDLKYSDPARLGATLNYAVFNYEHLDNQEKAAELIKIAIDNIEKDYEDMSDDGKVEVLEIMELMRTNLVNWGEVEGVEEEEEEEDVK